MATKKKTSEVSVVPPKTNKEQVVGRFKKSVCLELKKGCVIFSEPKDGKPLHSGIAKNPADAWKLALNSLL